MSVSTHSNSEEIACPHCGAIERDLNEYEWRRAQDTITTYCGKCKGKFTLTRERTVAYTATTVPSWEVPS